MITYEEALREVLAVAASLGDEALPLAEAHGRVLARDIPAPFPLPRFTNSAVDGFAVTEADLRSVGSPLKIERTVAAGDPPGEELKPGTTVRIFTGAPTPPGTAAVAMQEDVLVDGSFVTLQETLRHGAHVRVQGEEFSVGAVALPRGLRLNSAGVSLAAMLGLGQVWVHRPPKIGVLTTGAELVDVGEPAEPHQIYESNSYAMQAELGRLGLAATVVRRISDDLQETVAAVEDSLFMCDVLVTTGGVSVGGHDVLKAAFEHLGVETVFWKVAIKPGKPAFFGKQGQRVVFGLPGNPMSALVTFRLFARPYLLATLGVENPVPACYESKLTARISHKAGRREFIPAVGDGKSVRAISGQGSHMMGGLAVANALIDMPADVEELEAGNLVRVLPFAEACL